MARKPREEVEGGIFHVFARGNWRQRIYLDDQDRRTYLAMLGNEVMQRRWRCMTFCLMETHVHLLLQTPEPNLARGMQHLHGLYADVFNKRHRRVGHLFQGRYGAVRITTDEQLWATVRYIALNPVEAGLCRRPEDWRWSSHPSVLGRTGPQWLDVSGLLSRFQAVGGDPRARYADLISYEQTA